MVTSQCLNDYHAVVFFPAKDTPTDIYTIQRYISGVNTSQYPCPLSIVERHEGKTIDGVTGDFICLSFKASTFEAGESLCNTLWGMDESILCGTGCFCSQCEVKGVVRPNMVTRSGRRVLVDFHQQLRE